MSPLGHLSFGFAAKRFAPDVHIVFLMFVAGLWFYIRTKKNLRLT